MIPLIMFDSLTSEISVLFSPRNRNTYITITHEGCVRVRTPLKDMQAYSQYRKRKRGMD